MSASDFERYKILLKSALLGSGRAIFSLPLEHPFDTIKTNMQSRQESFAKTFKYIIQKKGWRGFYNGFSLNAVRVAGKSFFRWPLWIGYTNFWSKILKINQFTKQTVIGLSISTTELLIICPLQRLKVWLMTTNNQQTNFRAYLKTYVSIRDLYKGMTPLFLRQTLSWTSFLISSQYSKQMVRNIQKKNELNQLQILCSTIPVSIINTLFIMPADCIKTFYQEYSSKVQNKNFTDFFRQAKLKYGINGLYIGWNIRLVQYTINSGFTSVVFEKLMKQNEKVGS